ncbi:hypothetical protein HanIR_Chr02g0082711 [Helianthus annuus]|nr:hypothetical protein HanIR_Chr02g0082711 [Helianthus annuus]
MSSSDVNSIQSPTSSRYLSLYVPTFNLNFMLISFSTVTKVACKLGRRNLIMSFAYSAFMVRVFLFMLTVDGSWIASLSSSFRLN